MAKKPLELSGLLKILLIEDDPDDLDLFKYTLRTNNLTFELNVIVEGDQVLPYLHTAQQLPDVIVLDLNLPKVHGRDVLKQIKESVELKQIPIAILTTSSSQDDQAYCYKLGANVFLTKPTNTAGFQLMMATIVDLIPR